MRCFRCAVALATFLALGSSASAQVSVSIYGGHTSIDGQRWLGHGLSNPFPIMIDRFVERTHGGVYGASLRHETQAVRHVYSFEYYFEGLHAKGSISDTGPAGIIRLDVNGHYGLGSPDTQSRTLLERQRYELGIRADLTPPGAKNRLFLVPFIGLARDDGTSRIVSTLSYIHRDARIRSHYAGVELGAERKFSIHRTLDLIVGGALGGYWIDADGEFSVNRSVTNDFVTHDARRAGLRARGSLELMHRWSDVWSTSLLGQAVVWSDMPHFAMTSNNLPTPPAGVAFDELVEFRVLLKLTAKIGK